MTFEEAKALLRKESDCQKVPCGNKLCDECDLYVPIHTRTEAIRVVLDVLDKRNKELKTKKEELKDGILEDD